MKRVAHLFSAVALGATILAPGLYFADQLSLETMQAWLLVAAVVWFVATPLWMEHTTH